MGRIIPQIMEHKKCSKPPASYVFHTYVSLQYYRGEKKHTFWGVWTWARSCAGPPRDDVPQKMEPQGIDRISVTFGQDKPACID